MSLTAPPGSATISVTSSAANPVPYGTSVTITASITGSGVQPTGTVTFYDGSGHLAASQIQNGVVAYSSSKFSVGNHAITVQYGGDSNYNSGTSSILTLIVKAGSPAVTVTPSSTTISISQSLSVAVTLSGGSGNPVPTGSVTLTGTGANMTSPSYTSAPISLVSGSATFAVPGTSLGGGQNTLTAAHTPDAASASLYTTATASTTVFVTGTAMPGVTVTPSATAITDQQNLSVTVAVAGAIGSPAPTGVITLASGSYSAQLALPGGANDAVTFTIPAGTLNAGSNTLTAAYSGDRVYGASSGTTVIDVSQVIVSIPAPAMVTPGSSTSSTVILNTGSSYSGTQHLSCSLTTSPANAQSLPTCSLSPTSVTVGTGATVTTSLTVSTTAASAALVSPFDKLRSLGEGGLALAGLLIFGTSLRRHRWVSMMALLVLAVSIAGMGCGSGANSSSGGNPTSPATTATTAGAYVFTVTATDSTNTSITASSTVTATVR